MTSQGTAHGRFTRAIKSRNLWAAEMALREIGKPSLLDALDYLDLLAETRPEKLESGIRKWLTYIALLIAAGTVIGDLITFLTFFLQGELTTRFVLKVLTVVAIAGSIFWYYLGSLKKGVGHGEA